MAADNGLAQRWMLREVMRHVNNADTVLLHDLLMTAVHSTYKALSPTSWIAQCTAEHSTFEDIPAQPSNRILRSRVCPRVGQQAADLSGSTMAPVVTTRRGHTSQSRRVGRHYHQMDALLRAPTATVMGYFQAPSWHAVPILMLGHCTCPGSMLTLLLVLICRIVVPVARRCIKMMKGKCLRLTFAGATSASMSKQPCHLCCCAGAP
jgi:ABC-type nickel/cobalt efflux system permease component RcnA